MVLILYFVQLIVLSLYSWALIDPNITLFNHPLWSRFLETVLQLGYHNRSLSSMIFIEIIAGLFVFNYYFSYKNKSINPMKLGLIIGFVLIFSYPFLSHDFFNYLFDAKILTFYGKNPWQTQPLYFPNDPWLRFMHWVHRSYPYGPVFLPLTLIPSFLAFGKFILNFFFFKIFFTGFYLASVFYLDKLSRKWAVFFATCPLIIIEGLVNNHNDLIAVCFGLSGIYYLNKTKKYWLAKLLLLLSSGVKYITLPIILFKKNKNTQGANINSRRGWNLVVGLGLLIVVVYLTFFNEMQPWYWLNILILIPYYFKYFKKIITFFFGLLLSYYPFVAIGDWTNQANITLKHNIVLFFTILNILYLIITKSLYKKLVKKIS